MFGRKKRVDIDLNTNEVGDENDLVYNQDNMYDDYVDKSNEEQNENNDNEISNYELKEPEHKDNYLETHTVITKQSKNSKLLLIGFYSLAIIIIIIVLLLTLKK